MKNKMQIVRIAEGEGCSSVIVNEDSYYASGIKGRSLDTRFLCSVKPQDNLDKKKKQKYIDRHERYVKHRMG